MYAHKVGWLLSIKGRVTELPSANTPCGGAALALLAGSRTEMKGAGLK